MLYICKSPDKRLIGMRIYVSRIVCLPGIAGKIA